MSAMTTQAWPKRSAALALQTIACFALLLTSLGAAAQSRAWLDRDRIGWGETVTLNVETTASVAPDYAPLQREFTISGNSSRRQFEMRNGRSTTSTLYAVALQPRRDGLLTIPSLIVGNQRTQAMTLLVTAAVAAPAARAGDDVFIQSEADDQDPYVQQAVGWVVRLYSAVPLISGQIDQAAPDGASLQRVGDDAQYTRQIGGRRYTVVERRYLLVPERSGSLTIPGAQFEGRGAGGFFDDLFDRMSPGRNGAALRSRGAPRVLQVRAAPANAPQPWLPLHALTLRYKANPQGLQAGVASSLTIEASADGATAAQMPELQLPPIEGVQVFAEPVQALDSFSNGRPKVTLTRTFSLVPSRAGAATMPGLRIGWWDVRAGAAREATLPALNWQVMAGAGATAADPVDSAASRAAAPTQTGGSNRGWVLASVAFAALWLLTLVWALQRRSAVPAIDPVVPAVRTTSSRPGAAGLKRALDTGDFNEVIDVLCATADPPARGIDELIGRLDDPRQRAALDTMQHARWGGGDGVAARAGLREAFARGPRWRASDQAVASPLPPLYPPG